MPFKQEKPYYCGPASLVVLETDLHGPPHHSQDEWAVVAGTTTKGTSCAGLKRAIKTMGVNFEVVRKTLLPWKGTAIVYDKRRDHWMVASVVRSPDGAIIPGRYNEKLYKVYVADPEDGLVTLYYWFEFQPKFMNSVRDSYALVVSR